jgi:hypothetical protein
MSSDGKNPHAVALGRLGGLGNKGKKLSDKKRQSLLANLERARKKTLSRRMCACGARLSTQNKSGVCRECQRHPGKAPTKGRASREIHYDSLSD